MAHATYIREKAREQRLKRRLTIDQIAERMDVSRSTVYYWVRDLPIHDAVRHSGPRRAARRKGNRAMQRKYRLLREDAYREGLESYASLASDPSFRDFVCLYIAEGYKRSRNGVSMCNSDPAVMQLGAGWLARLTKRPVHVSFQHHADQDADELRRFWGAALGVELDAIEAFRKSNSGQLRHRVWRCRYGVLTVRVHDTLLRARLQAWMDRLRASWQ